MKPPLSLYPFVAPLFCTISYLSSRRAIPLLTLLHRHLYVTITLACSISSLLVHPYRITFSSVSAFDSNTLLPIYPWSYALPVFFYTMSCTHEFKHILLIRPWVFQLRVELPSPLLIVA